MYLCLIITIDRARSTLLITVNNVNTVYTCVYFVDNVGKLSSPYCVNGTHDGFQCSILYFLSLTLIPKWLTHDID